MNISKPFTCEQAVAAMDQKLSHDDDIAWREHVESCPDCLARVEQAASETGLEELPRRVAIDEFDAELALRDDWSTADFVVEFLEPATSSEFLGSLANYDIVEIIGRGGMGVVLKAYDRQLKRYVAIKTLAPHLANQPLARKRFAREAQAAAAVVDLNVIAIHQVHATGRIPFIMMPLLGGESVADRLKRDGAFELTEVLRIGMQVASGLAAAHQQGLVHRDVKPSNILLEKGVERAVLTDFGLARAVDDISLTRVNAISGTPEFMSPEAAFGQAVDARSDLFSLGCVLYTMASGVSPFRADSTIAVLRNVTEECPQALTAICPQLPPWFTALVERLLAKDPSQRIQSAREVATLLEQGLGCLQQPAEIRPPIVKSLKRPSTALRSWFDRTGRVGKTIMALAMLIVGGFACFGITLFQAPPDISGKWRGEGWGDVTLQQQAEGKYVGEYTDTFGDVPGTIHLQWSSTKKRFLGTWNEGTKRIGEISIRLDGEAIRGAWTVDLESSEVAGEGVKLDDLCWQRGPKEAAQPESLDKGNSLNNPSSYSPPDSDSQLVESNSPAASGQSLSGPGGLEPSGSDGQANSYVRPRTTEKAGNEPLPAAVVRRVMLSNIDGDRAVKQIRLVCHLLGFDPPALLVEKNSPNIVLIFPEEKQPELLRDWLLGCDLVPEKDAKPPTAPSIADQQRLRLLTYFNSQIEELMKERDKFSAGEIQKMKQAARESAGNSKSVLSNRETASGSKVEVRFLEFIQPKDAQSFVDGVGKMFGLRTPWMVNDARTNTLVYDPSNAEFAKLVLDLADVGPADKDTTAPQLRTRWETRLRLLSQIRLAVEQRIKSSAGEVSFEAPASGLEVDRSASDSDAAAAPDSDATKETDFSRPKLAEPALGTVSSNESESSVSPLNLVEELAILKSSSGDDHPKVLEQEAQIAKQFPRGITFDQEQVQKRLAELEAERASLLSQKGEQHPDVIMNATRIALVRRIVEGESEAVLKELKLQPLDESPE